MKQQLEQLALKTQNVALVRQENVELRKRIKLSEEQLVEYQKASTETSALVTSVKEEIKKMNKRSKTVDAENAKLVAEMKRSKDKFGQQITEQTALVRKQRGQIENLKILCRNLQAVKSELEETIKALQNQKAEEDQSK